jgi:hypothetical protein
MRNELSLLRNAWPAVFLGAALVSGCGSVDAAPVGPSGAGPSRTVASAVGEGELPNLVVASLESPTVVQPWEELVFRVKVCNQGAAPAEGRVRFFLSPTPETSPGGGIALGETSVGELAPGQCVTREQPASAYQPEGGHDVVAVADADRAVAELSEEDNSRAHRLWIGTRPELVVTSIEAPPHVMPGADIPVKLTMCNQGNVGAWSASAGLYLSSDADISPADTFLAQTFPGGLLEAGSCTTWEGTVSNPMPEGQYFLGAVVDPWNSQEEADEENNALSGGTLGVAIGPDLVVSAVTAPVNTERDVPFTSQVTVCNQGTQQADGFFQLYLSPDPELSPWEEVYGWVNSAGFLAPGQCFTGELQVSVPMDGTWYLGAIVRGWSSSSPELLEINNTRVSQPFGVGSLPDFTVSSITVPPTVNPMNPFTTSVTVCNQGTRPGDTDLELSVVSGPDEQPLRSINTFYLGSLEAGQCVTQDVSAELGYLGHGPFHLRARTDAGDFRWELLEGNNTRTSERLNVSYF